MLRNFENFQIFSQITGNFQIQLNCISKMFLHRNCNVVVFPPNFFFFFFWKISLRNFINSILRLHFNLTAFHYLKRAQLFCLFSWMCVALSVCLSICPNIHPSKLQSQIDIHFLATSTGASLSTNYIYLWLQWIALWLFPVN